MLSNQRVVVLTDEEIKGIEVGLVFGLPDEMPPEIKSARTKFKTALGPPEGITNEHVEAAYAKAMEQTNFGWRWPHPTQALNARWIRGLLEAALFPGDEQ